MVVNMPVDASWKISQARRQRRQPLSEEVATHVRALIMSGALRTGEFVRLDRVAEQLAVSATPVREALHALRGEGFLTFEPRRGFVVAPLSPQDVEDLFLVQADIAGELAARAARAASPEWLAELRDLQAQLIAATGAGQADEVVEFNRLVHRHINLRAESPKLAFLLSVAVRYVPQQPFFTTIDGWLDASTHDHEEVVAALEAGDAEAARTSMRRHILHAGTLLAEHLRQRDAAAEASSVDAKAR